MHNSPIAKLTEFFIVSFYHVYIYLLLSVSLKDGAKITECPFNSDIFLVDGIRSHMPFNNIPCHIGYEWYGSEKIPWASHNAMFPMGYFVDGHVGH